MYLSVFLNLTWCKRLHVVINIIYSNYVAQMHILTYIYRKIASTERQQYLKKYKIIRIT